MRIKTRLYGAFLIVAILVAFVGGINLLMSERRDVMVSRSNEIEHIQLALTNTVVAHNIWVKNVYSFFVNKADKLEVQIDSTRCQFGQFLYGDELRHVNSAFPSIASILERVKDPHTRIHNGAAEINRLWLLNDDESRKSALAVLEGNINQALKEVTRILNEAQKEAQQLDHQIAADMATNIAFAKKVTWSAIIGAFLVTAFLGFKISQGILIPLKKAADLAEKIGSGDISSERLNLGLNDEIGQMAYTMDKMADALEIKSRLAENARQSAESANRAKSIFLANMSHELRTPLNAVLGFSQVMKNSSDVTMGQKENLDIIIRSGEHLLSLINNVLDISKIESGRVELEPSHCDLHQLMQEMKSWMHVQAQEKWLDFSLEQSPDLPRYVTVDGGKLRQVLINLIGNAIKYTNQGRVILRARIASLPRSNQVRVRFEIEDTGTGIRKEDQDRIFLPFVQLGEGSQASAGTGLGLAICKQYVKLMNGDIGVSSGHGKGSVFHFEIPIAVLPSEAMPTAPRRGQLIGLMPGQPRYRLLIAEDQPENRMLLRKLLDPLGFDLQEAANGQEAVDYFEQWCPHLIWMDMRMPILDGLEATRRIRAMQAGATVKIVAVTAHALETERCEIMAAGCDDFIRKPYKDVEIFDALAKHLGVRFIFEEEIPVTAAVEHLNTTALADLPDELQNELEQAIVRIDSAAISHAIENTHLHNPALAKKLAAMAKDLQYGQILRLIRKTHGETNLEDKK